MGYISMIFIASAAGEPMKRVELPINVIEGVGLKGDRYAEKSGAFSKAKREVIRHVTFIENETIEAVRRDYGLDQLLPEHTRRNIVTVGVPLNHLVGQVFEIGYASFVGVELCEPCKRPGALSGNDDIKEKFELAFKHRGGLRAEVLNSGIIAEKSRIIY